MDSAPPKKLSDENLFNAEVTKNITAVEGFLVGLNFYTDYKEAVAEAMIEAFADWYENHKLEGTPVPLDDVYNWYPVDSGQVLDWLRENRHIIKSIFEILA